MAYYCVSIELWLSETFFKVFSDLVMAKGIEKLMSCLETLPLFRSVLVHEIFPENGQRTAM